MEFKWKAALAAMSVAATPACYPFMNSCVARGTWVRTPSGPRRVEDLAIGDEVLSLDPEGGELHPTRLTAIRKATRECVALSFPGGRLVCTSDHPLFCPEEKRYAPAGDWVLGKRSTLLTDSGGEVRVESKETFAGVHDVFDLSVEHALHNFVADGVLVHNKEPAPPSCKAADGGVYQPPDGTGPLFHGSGCDCPGGAEGRVDCSSSLADRCECSTDAGAGGQDGGSTDAGDGG